MNDQEQNTSSNEKTPQEELEELLQQSGTGKADTGIKIPSMGIASGKFNILGLGIILLILVLIAGTSYLVFQSSSFNTLDITFNLNEDEVSLQIDDEGLGRINSGEVIKVKAGDHKLLLAKEGFLDLEENLVFVKNQDLTLEFELLEIPEIERVIEIPLTSMRLSNDGSEISYFDEATGLFKSLDLETEETATLFDIKSLNIVDIQWSSVAQSALVKLQGRNPFRNIKDNREEPGRYIPLGEKPVQKPSNFNGISTWLFDDELREAAGWLPVLLTDNARQATFSSDGSSIIYIHEPADGEYSLVKAWPDGLEWERVVTELPRVNKPELIWGADDRFLLIKDEPNVLLADLISGEVRDSEFSDRLANSHIEMSTDGNRVAYIATVNGKPVVRIYDINGAVQTIGNLAVDANTVFVFTDNSTLLISLSSSMLKKIDTERNVRTTIPLIGESIDSTIRRMEYSRIAKLLIMITDTGVFKMRI